MSELNGKTEVNENPENSKSSDVSEKNENSRKDALDSIDDDLSPEDKSKEFSEKDKQELKNETGWSDEIVDSVKSKEEAEIYKNADLQESEVDGKKCLIRNDIDSGQKDEFGRTNKERMENGNPPLTKSGETVELHHIGQKQDSPLAELTTQEHRGKGNDTILHDKTKESEIDRSEFSKERQQHWESRSNDY